MQVPVHDVTEQKVFMTSQNDVTCCRSEEMEDMKRKLTNKLMDAESELEAAHAKINQLEKAKSRIAGELEDVMVEVERVSGVGGETKKVREREIEGECVCACVCICV